MFNLEYWNLKNSQFIDMRFQYTLSLYYKSESKKKKKKRVIINKPIST